MERKKVTVPDILSMKKQGRKITKVNLHDYPTAVLADRAGIDIVMIGDSIGMVVLGYENTIPVTMEEMIHQPKPWSGGPNIAWSCATCLSCLTRPAWMKR